ncbi:MAG: hypothetical protein CL793_07825 [Chloroflexi bacterium]|nr:hypothetical protein [Chloroflexota bacterium]|tara:strand:+ start:584 stop:1576 length:993 start_codon:yes stop_codon:yes gene_type:complete
MATMDVFESDAFNMRSLTAAINATPFVPGRVSELGIFEESGVTTTKVSVERLAPSVGLVATSARGAPPVQNTADLRTLYDLNTSRIAISDTLYADSVQGVRAFGSETDVQALQAEVNSRFEKLAQRIAATIEFQRFTALEAVTMDSNGTTALVTSADVFPGSVPAALDMALGSTGVRTKISQVIRSIENALGGRSYSSIHCFCDDTFFDNLVSNADVIDSYKYVDGGALRDRTARRSISVGGIDFEEYRPGTPDPLGNGTAIAFPIGAGIFKSVFAPADYNDTVNTTGLPLYARQFADPLGDRFRLLEAQSNVLNVCVEPSAVYPLDDGV